MPRSAEQNAALRSESRRRIMDAALRLFAQRGYTETSVREIAQAAGVAQGLLYNYFASKELLLLAIFERSIADVLRSFAIAEEAGGPDERVERLIRASFSILQEQRDFWQLGVAVRAQAGVIAGLAEHLQPWAATIRERLERYLREAGHPQPAIEAELLFALIDGVGQHYLLDPTRYPLEPVIAAMVARYTPAGSAEGGAA